MGGWGSTSEEAMDLAVRKTALAGAKSRKVPMSPDPSRLSEVDSGMISLAHLPGPPKCSVR